MFADHTEVAYAEGYHHEGQILWEEINIKDEPLSPGSSYTDENGSSTDADLQRYQDRGIGEADMEFNLLVDIKKEVDQNDEQMDSHEQEREEPCLNINERKKEISLQSCWQEREGRCLNENEIKKEICIPYDEQMNSHVQKRAENRPSGIKKEITVQDDEQVHSHLQEREENGLDKIKIEIDVPNDEQIDNTLQEREVRWLNERMVKQEENFGLSLEARQDINFFLDSITKKPENIQHYSATETHNTDGDFPSFYFSLYDKVKVEITEGSNFYPPEHNDENPNSSALITDTGFVEDLPVTEESVQRSDRFPCIDCGDNFNKLEELAQHRRKVVKPLTCELCDKNFKSECVLATHIRIHTGERPFQCKLCGQTFFRTCYLLKHRRRRHGCNQPNFACKICSKVFSKVGLLSAHMRAHYLPPKSLTCEQCGKHFTRGKYLSRHKRRTHSIDKLRCKICGELQETRTALISHVVEHTGVKPFNCGECGEEFTSTLQLTRHSRIHKGELPFGCNACQLSFWTADQLRSHRRHHTGERPFCCIFCGRAFRNEADLILHVHSHTDP